MTSFYLKYRPQRIVDLDLTAVREFFERLVKGGKISHAYLFAGPRGTGKTSAARILAKIVNCESKKVPCNRCSACKAIAGGRFADLIEIDAASNRGIDDVRALRETIALAPFKGKKKVYLIDEVHMLTMEAFNALLKTLEEPPEHVVFVLATTEPERLPETVVSRCVKVNFSKATETEVLRSLKKIVKGEKLKVDEEGLMELSRSVDGSFRDGQKLLEQLVMGRGRRKITLEQVREELGKGKSVAPKGWLEFLARGDANQALKELGRLDEAGAKWKEVIGQSLEAARREMLGRLGVGERTGGGLTGLADEELRQLTQKLMQAGRELRDAAVPQLPLELLTLEWCDKNEKRKTRGAKRKKENLPAGRVISYGKGRVKLEEIRQKWQEVLKQLRPKNHSLEGLLRSARPVGVEGDRLKLEVFYQFHLDQLKKDRFRRIIEGALKQVFAISLKLEYILGSSPARKAKEDKKENSDLVQAAEEIFGDTSQ